MQSRQRRQRCRRQKRRQPPKFETMSLSQSKTFLKYQWAKFVTARMRSLQLIVH